ncbi:MAG: hypothetical protein HKN72_16945 [Gemmatimonadetes bacterium]|nr:hypothetical protein [Gemmatimonadota bacterium]NNF14918.1 hypothetical protein [Gemmatimonadota bacterium]NNL30650.1 hypothetical protein [Gemmatimonadota bacterium]
MMTNPARTTRLRRRPAKCFALAFTGAALFLTACSDEGPVSGPGTITATLVGPNGSEGAAVVSLLGDGIGSVSGVGNTSVHARSGDSSLRVILIDQTGGTLSFEVAVPDTTQPPAVVIHEVAGPDDALRPSVDGYTLEFAR